MPDHDANAACLLTKIPQLQVELFDDASGLIRELRLEIEPRVFDVLFDEVLAPVEYPSLTHGLQLGWLLLVLLAVGVVQQMLVDDETGEFSVELLVGSVLEDAEQVESG